MKTKLILLLLLTTLTMFCKGQPFYILDSADVIKVNVPRPLQAYTYNTFSVTDSSLSIISPKDKLDLIIREPNKDQNIIISFPSTERIKGKTCYNQKTGEPVIFTINADRNYNLISDKYLSFHFIVNEFGDLQEFDSLPSEKNFSLSRNRTFGFKYIPDTVGYSALNLSLYHNSELIEIKQFPLNILPGTIKFSATTDIENVGYDKLINYKITSSMPVPADINISLQVTLAIDGFEFVENLNNLTLKKATTATTGNFKKSIRGRYPKSFLIKNTNLKIDTLQASPNYIIQTTNL